MKYVMIAAFALLVAIAAFAQVDAPPTYTLTQVHTPEDVVACGKAGGAGAVLFELDSEGNAVDTLGSYCVQPVR